MNSSWRNL